MRIFYIFVLTWCVSGCNGNLSSRSELSYTTKSDRLTISPDRARLPNPTVATDRTVLEYDLDLDRCKSVVSAQLGLEENDDLASLRRTLKQGPLGEKVRVDNASDDLAQARSRLVRECLSKRGYLVIR